MYEEYPGNGHRPLLVLEQGTYVRNYGYGYGYA
jgi:hypothetical protein